jgi:hypothetical protein
MPLRNKRANIVPRASGVDVAAVTGVTLVVIRTADARDAGVEGAF